MNETKIPPRAIWMRRLLIVFWLIVCATRGPAAVGQEFFERYEDWPEQTTIRGTLVIAPTADSLESQIANVRELLDGRALAVIHRSNAELPEAVRRVAGQLSEQVTMLDLRDTNAVRDSSNSHSCMLIYADSRTADFVASWEQHVVQLQEHLTRSGMLIVVGEGAETVGMWSCHLPAMIAAETEAASGTCQGVVAGLGLLPGCLLRIVERGLDEEWGSESAGSLNGLGQQLQGVDVQLTADSLLVLSGRLLQVYGPGHARLSLADASAQPAPPQVLRSRVGRRPTSEWLADLTQWRRRAMELKLEPFPPEERQIPEVPHGALLIVGGGGVPDGLMERFVELAGGVEKARLVYIPCSEEERVSEGGILRQWRAMGVEQVAQLHTKDRRKANEDESLLELLRTATGLWYGGGRQWNFADSYYGTEAHRLMKDVLRRGGVVGGSSAGASIQASYLARATPIGNTDIMAPGYERGGLGFIRGVAIDQHFSQRNRHADLQQLVTRYPQVLGIGIDETTAIEVVGSHAKVLGEGRVFFDQWIAEAGGGQVQVTALSAGEVYDLGKRSVVEKAVR